MIIKCFILLISYFYNQQPNCMVNISLPVCPGKFHLYQCTNSKACKYLRLCDIFDRFCPYTTATSTATLSSAHQISENSDQQQPQQRSASHGGGCGWRSPYTGQFGRGCRWRSRLRLKIAVVDGALKILNF